MWDPTLSDAFHSDLRPGERVLWAGRPGSAVKLNPAYLVQIPFFIAWTCFSLFWEGTVIASGAPWYMAMFGLPFILLGLHMLIGRFVIDALVRRRTVYAVTSERLLVLWPGLFGRVVMQTGLRDVVGVAPSVNPDGRGILRFQPRVPESWLTEIASWSSFGGFLEGLLNPGRSPGVAFDMIPHAEQVADLIRRAREELLAADDRPS